MPSFKQAGEYNFSFEVWDAPRQISTDRSVTTGAYVSRNVRITVQDVNAPPVLTLLDPDVPVGSPPTEDGSVTLSDLVRLLAAFGTNETQPNFCAACDLNGDGSISLTDIVGILNAFGTVNWPPRNSASTPVKLSVDKMLQLYVTVSDVDSEGPEGAPLPALTASGLPEGAQFTTESITTIGGRKVRRGRFSWTPTSSQKGKGYGVQFKANDGSTTAGQMLYLSVL